MNTYKLKSNATDVNCINRENFEKDTRKQPPYYQPNKESQYAVCPYCGNPISIIGLYNSGGKVKPYGKHYPKSVENLAVYDKYSYETCPLASHVWKDTEKVIKQKVDNTSKEVITFMYDNFDSIIRLLRQVTGIIFNDKIIAEMIDYFLSKKCYCYQNIYPMNSAWIFGYMQCRVNFFGMTIDEHSQIYNTLINHPDITIENKRIVKNSRYIKPEFYFMLHRTQQKDNIKSEYINYYIDINGKNICEQQIKIDLPLFSKILNRKTEKTANDIRYIEMFQNACKKYLAL